MPWRDEIAVLAQRHAWLETFKESVEEAGLRAAASESGSVLAYNPLAIESLLESLASLAGRCLDYRREARNLEIAAVKCVKDYELFVETSRLEEELEIAGLRREQIAVERSSSGNASQAFGNSSSNLGLGYQIVYAGRNRSLGLDEKQLEAAEELIRQKWASHRLYQAAFMEMHQTDGNAHNYQQRAERVLELYLDDFKELMQKARAVEVGLRIIYDSIQPLPKLSAEDAVNGLDRMVDWIRDVMRHVERESQIEVEYDLTVPLRQPWRSNGVPIVSDRAWQEAVEAAKDGSSPLIVRFSLDDVLFSQDRVRLRGIGLSFGNRAVIPHNTGIDRAGTRDSYIQLRATIQTPEQTYVDVDQQFVLKRPPVLMGNVGLYRGSSPAAFDTGQGSYNVNPTGEWTLWLEPVAVWKDSSWYSVITGIENDVILDIKLHLRLVARPGTGTHSRFRAST